MWRRDFILACAGLAFGIDHRASRNGDDPAGSSLDRSRAPFALGINSHLLRDDDLRLVRELGFTHVRGTLYTPLWSETPSYAVTTREALARVADHGLRPLFVVHNAWGPVFRMGHDPEEARRFTNVASAMVRALPGVDSWQLWNEQDVWVQAPFGAGARPRRTAERVGRNYGEWWKTSYPRLKELSPDASFVPGAPADHPDNRWRGFLRGMLETGAPFEAIAIHAYGDWEYVRSRLLDVRAIAGSTLPIWLTECGAPADGGWSAGRQLDAWRSTIEGNTRETLAQRVYLYCLETDPVDPRYGIRNVDGSERPVLAWLRRRS